MNSYKRSSKRVDEEVDPDTVYMRVADELGIDERFWYPISLAFWWRNDLLNWADKPR